MEIRDLFVSMVAITIGVMMLYAALINRGWCFQMKIVRSVEEARNRQSARTFIGIVGMTMTLIGLYLLLAPWLASELVNPSETRNPNWYLPHTTIARAEESSAISTSKIGTDLPSLDPRRCLITPRASMI